jgi:carbohydrate diacid regulator
MNKVAGRLFIHRNTLRYRLERIAELTNKDPRKVKDLLELYLSILQNQFK